MHINLNTGDIVLTKVDFCRSDKILIPKNSPGQIVGVCEQADLRGKHPFSYQVHWFTENSEVPMTISIKWLWKCEDKCDSCQHRFLCFTNRQNLKPLSPEELDVIKANWENKK